MLGTTSDSGFTDGAGARSGSRPFVPPQTPVATPANNISLWLTPVHNGTSRLDYHWRQATTLKTGAIRALREGPGQLRDGGSGRRRPAGPGRAVARASAEGAHVGQRLRIAPAVRRGGGL